MRAVNGSQYLLKEINLYFALKIYADCLLFTGKGKCKKKGIMKIKRKYLSYEKVIKLPKAKAFVPKKPNFLFSSLVRLLAVGELRKTKFTYTSENKQVLD